MQPFVIGLVVFSVSVWGAGLWKCPVHCWGSKTLPRKHFQAVVCDFSDRPCTITQGRYSWAPWGDTYCLMLLSSGSKGSWTPGMTEQKSRAEEPRLPVVTPSSFIFFHFSTLHLAMLCWTHSSFYTLFHVLCSGGDAECSGCFWLGGQLCLSSHSIAAISCWAAGVQPPLGQHSSHFWIFNSEDFGADFPSLFDLGYID